MGKANYETIRQALAKREAFDGNTMSAVRYEHPTEVFHNSFSGELFTYVVFSYETPIAGVREDGTVIIPNVRYSISTTRQQNLCRSYLKD